MKELKIKAHNRREYYLLNAIQYQSSLINEFDSYQINKIDGMVSSLYMLEIIDEPFPIITLKDVREIAESIKEYLLKI